MAWGPKARRQSIELYRAGHPEKDIVRSICSEFRCDDKSVRRCIAGLDLIQEGGTGETKESLEIQKGLLREAAVGIADRFARLGGTEHYLRELRRVYETSEHLPLARLSFAMGAHFKELMDFGTRLRDRLTIAPHVAVLSGTEKLEAVWHGSRRTAWSFEDESGQAQDWGRGIRRQRHHHLFQPLAYHLKGNPCWGVLLCSVQRRGEQSTRTNKTLSYQRQRVRRVPQSDSTRVSFASEAISVERDDAGRFFRV